MFKELIVLTTVCANFFLAYITLKKNYRSASNLLLGALAGVLALWTVFNFLALQPGDEATRLFWVRVVMLVTSALGPLLFLLSEVFPDTEAKLPAKTWLGLGILMGSTALLAMTPYMFVRLANLSDGNFMLYPGPAIVLFAIDFLGLTSIAMYRLVQKYRRSTGLLKQQLRVFLIGLLLSFGLLSVTNFVAVVVFRSISLTFLGPPFTLFMVGSIAYAVVKHKFLDIKLIIVRSIAYSLLFSILFLSYVIVLMGLGRLLTGQDFSSNGIGLWLLMTFIITVSFEPLKQFTEQATENLFYRRNYNDQEVLGMLSQIMASTIDLNQLSDNVMLTLQDQLQISDQGIITFSEKQLPEVRRMSSTVNFLSDVAAISSLLQRIPEKLQHSVIYFENLAESPFKTAMRELNLAILVPLYVQNQFIGALVMGDKPSGENYTTKDLDLLEILSSQLAVAVQNSVAFEKIRKFNITLNNEVQHATAELTSANQRLRQLDDLKDEFVSIASHELRTPMGAIKSMVSMILEGDYGEISSGLKEPLQDINVSVDRLVNLVNNMLNISRIEQGRMKFTLSDFEASELIGQVVSSLVPLAKSRGIELISSQFPVAKIQADQDKLVQILDNLIGNALKFTESQGKVTVSAAVLENLYTLYITDTGVGISPEDQKRLFGKFQQISSQQKGKPMGSGLGLYISRELARKMGGELWIESSEHGKGSTFAVSFPLSGSATASKVHSVIEFEAEQNPNQR